VIIERIKRKIEPEMYILSQSTPVIYFGNYDTAKACTVSINPSDRWNLYLQAAIVGGYENKSID